MPSQPDETPVDPTEPADATAPEERAVPDEVAATDEARIPSEDELERTATPATVRRAPKFSAFMIVGALVGMVLGLLFVAIVQPGPDEVGGGAGLIGFLDGEGSVRLLGIVTGGVVGTFVGGALAVRADRRSRPPRLDR
ncbi:histidine kinase [Cellulomonas sp. JH27-2]|uniref:histidine kinase n=1 Tax=Cellulomonas sp. JH27-2 TaxID=2774139 RepID=UPI001CD888FF|nr:histidine kinase [Cellulomonas sp. JH27-2]